MEMILHTIVVHDPGVVVAGVYIPLEHVYSNSDSTSPNTMLHL